MPWADVLGVSGEEHRPLPAAGVPVHSERYGTFTASLWSEHLTADGAEVLATYAGAGLDGRPAILRHGSAWYVSTVPPAPVLAAIVADCVAAAGVRAAGPDACPTGSRSRCAETCCSCSTTGTRDAELAVDGPRPADRRPTWTGCCGCRPAVPRC